MHKLGASPSSSDLQILPFGSSTIRIEYPQWTWASGVSSLQRRASCLSNSLRYKQTAFTEQRVDQVNSTSRED